MSQISCIGPQFEAFGYRFMNHFIATPLTHRGLNVMGHSVGYTVDSFDATGKFVAEYSAKTGYFSGSMDKPVEDLLHAVRLYSNVENIFLVSSDTCGTTEERNFLENIKLWPGFSTRIVHIYDCRKIAEAIVDHLLISDLAIDQLSEFLPELKKIQGENSANLLAPTPDFHYLERNEVELEIISRLEATRCLIISGIGGSGKSEAAADYAHAMKSTFDLIIWINGADVTKVTDLESIALNRRGTQHNVAWLLKMRRCLVIIDDATTPIDPVVLSTMCGTDSRVIITQRHVHTDCFKIPAMPKKQAFLLLNRGVTEESPKKIWETVWDTVGGHPLTLRLMNSAVIEGATWHEMQEDCRFIGQLVDDAYQLVADRLLSRMKKTLRRELAVFAWLESPVGDQGVLRHLIGPAGIRKLQSHSVTTTDRSRSLKIHDIVFASMQKGEWLTPHDVDEWTATLETYLTSVVQSHGLELHAAASAMRKKLEYLYKKGNCQHVFLYTLLQGWLPEEIDVELIGDPEILVRKLEKKVTPSTMIETATILEAIECIYRSDKHSHGFEQAKVNLEQREPLFPRLSNLPNLTPLQTNQIIHHHGKALVLLEKFKDAIALFESVIAGEYPLYESRLQLVRLYTKQGHPQKSVEQAEIILRAATETGNVTTSVILATIESLPAGKDRDRLMKSYADLAESEIHRAAGAGLDHAVNAFAAIGRHWGWNDEDRFERVWNSVPRNNPKSDQERFAHAELHQIAAKVLPEQELSLRETALSLFDDMEKLNDFQAQKFGQALVESGRAEKAREVLSGIGKKSPWVEYWLSKACYGSNDFAEAHEHANKAINELSEGQRSYLSSFLSHRFDIRSSLNDAAAVEDLEAAITECTNDKYKKELQLKLKRNTKSVN